MCVRAETEPAAVSAEARALGEIDRLASVFSGYDAASEFRRWQKILDQPARFSDELFEPLAASDRWRERSDGAFDPRVQVLTEEFWTRRAGLDRLPKPDELAEGENAHGPTRVAARRCDGHGRAPDGLPAQSQLDRQGLYHRPRLRRRAGSRSGCPWRALGTSAAMFAWSVTLPRPSGSPPRLEIRERRANRPRRGPRSVGRDQRHALTRGFRIQGKWYSHIFNPRTGQPAGNVANATVIADRAADANALATTLNVLSVEDGLRLIASVPGPCA